LLNFQTIGFTFVPDPKANRVRIAPEPRPATLEINNNIKYVDGKCRGRHRQIRMDISPDPLAPSVSFHGRYPGSCGESTLHRVVLAPAPLVFAVFTTQWSEMGGTLTGQLRTRATPKAARHLYTARSRPLAELLRGVNKYSNNVMARHLFLTLGAERFGPPGTVEKGRAALGEWLQDQRLDLPELFVDNGSGLSRQTRISAHSLVRLLVRAYQSPFLAEFAASLPISGVDGTLRRRFQGEPLARHLRMKTGTIDDVRAIAGYLSTRSGRTYAVAMLHNHPGIHQGSGTQVQDALLRWLFER
jgi:D-alanyl-D-alanine carboxypeptidase/D-alanyl-D-alanine-endopeptidase (penicillin-binding protein 4)